MIDPSHQPAAGRRIGFVDAVVDLSGLAGAGLVSFGCWQIYSPAGYIAAGLFCLTVAAIGARRRGA